MWIILTNQVSHGALQFMAYEEGRKFAISYRSQKFAGQETPMHGEQLLVIFESPESNFASFVYILCEPW